MSRHLDTCKQRPADSPPARQGTRRSDRRFHLLVGTPRGSTYWLHLEASSRATVEDLDALLRDTWLECCGHLSELRLGERRFIDTRGGYIDYGDEPMTIALGRLLSPGQTLQYQYDFGSTTELAIKVVSERPGVGSEPIEILARNDPPDFKCVTCEKPATMLCSQCWWSDDAWFCDDCAAKHACGEEMLLPIVNSPRVGVCGYTGTPGW